MEAGPAPVQRLPPRESVLGRSGEPHHLSGCACSVDGLFLETEADPLDGCSGMLALLKEDLRSPRPQPQESPVPYRMSLES